MFRPEEENIWGIDSSGLNNSGIIVLKQTEDLLRLGCSPGISSFDPPDFNSLIIEITTNTVTDAVGEYGAENVERMEKGLAPQKHNPLNPRNAGMESMELSHEPIPRREGGRDVVERWPQEHERIDPYRHTGYYR